MLLSSAYSLLIDKKAGRKGAYLFRRIHASESASVAGLATLLADVLNLFARAVGEVSGVGVVGHFVLFKKF